MLHILIWECLAHRLGGLSPPNPACGDGTKAMDDENFLTEMRHLLFLHSANFGKGKLLPQDLLNKIYDFKLQEHFPNACICLRILLTIPATVASLEWSFSKLKLIKNYLRATSDQSRVVYLAIFNIESILVQKVEYDDIIKTFAEKKARKVFLKQSRHLHQFLLFQKSRRETFLLPILSQTKRVSRIFLTTWYVQ